MMRGNLLLACLIASVRLLAQGASVSIGSTDIGGVVSGANGPEAGVWVIAETSDLPTKFAKWWSLMTAAVTSYRTFRRLHIACGCAATGWWIPRRSKRNGASF